MSPELDAVERVRLEIPHLVADVLRVGDLRADQLAGFNQSCRGVAHLSRARRESNQWESWGSAPHALNVSRHSACLLILARVSLPLLAHLVYRIVGDFKVVDGLPVIGRRGPKKFVAILIGRVHDPVLRLGDDDGLLGSSTLGHDVRLLTGPLAESHLVPRSEPEGVHRLGLKVLQDVRDIYFFMRKDE